MAHRRRIGGPWKWIPLFRYPLQLRFRGNALDEAVRAGFQRFAQIALGVGHLDTDERIFAEIERGLAALLALLLLVASACRSEDLSRRHLPEIERDDRARPDGSVLLDDGIDRKLARVVLAGPGARQIAPDGAVGLVARAVLKILGGGAIAAEIKIDVAAPAMGAEIVALQFDGGVVICECFPIAAERLIGVRSIEIGRLIFRVEADRRIVIGNRFLVLAERGIGVAAIVIGDLVGRAELQRHVVIGDRLLILSLPLEDVAAIDVGVLIAPVERDRGVEIDKRVVVLSRPRVGDAATVVRARPTLLRQVAAIERSGVETDRFLPMAAVGRGAPGLGVLDAAGAQLGRSNEHEQQQQQAKHGAVDPSATPLARADRSHARYRAGAGAPAGSSPTSDAPSRRARGCSTRR